MTSELARTVQRPVRVKIPHSIFLADTEDHSMCLFCKSEDKKVIEQYLAKNPIPAIGRVISMNDVVKLFKSFKERKQLRTEYSHFICDVNITKQLYNALGKTFNGIGQLPIPVNYDDLSALPKAVNKVLESTYMHLKGQNITFTIGFTSMDAHKIQDNIISGIDFAMEKIPGKWGKVHSIHIKTGGSPSLPIFGKMANEAIQVLRETVKSLSMKTIQESATNKASDKNLKRKRDEEAAPKEKETKKGTEKKLETKRAKKI